MSEYVDQIFKLIRIGYYSGMFLVIFILILDSWRVMKNVREGQLPHRKSVLDNREAHSLHSISCSVEYTLHSQSIVCPGRISGGIYRGNVRSLPVLFGSISNFSSCNDCGELLSLLSKSSIQVTS